MGDPGEIAHGSLSFAAASRVLAAIQDGPGVRGEGRANSALPPIEGYMLERELGRGGGGVTYLAHKAGSGAKVALKLLHLPLSEGRASQRAWRELDVLQQIRSPSVPRLLDYGLASQSLYIATEYVEGTPLDRRFESPAPRDADDLRTRVRMLERLARAAHSLHERGVIHRDLKPSNVIVGKGDEPFIIDLGIATLVTPDPMATLTVEGAPVGTPAFMAPEQARGERDSISTRTDVYALGAIGSWLCTGATPHDLAGATLHEAIRRVGSEEPRQPRSVSPELPRLLAAVLAKACAPKPGERYMSAAELAADLGRWLRREPVLATSPGVWRRIARRVERHPAWTTTILCLILGAAIVGSSVLVRQSTISRLYRQPFRVELDEEHGRWARLESRAGPLFEWTSDAERGVGFVELYDAGPAIRPRMRIATVIDGPPGAGMALDKQLCVWDARDPTRLLWQTRGTPDYLRAPRENLPPATSADLLSNPEAYTAGAAVVAEVFAESPGLEIIATHHHRFDPAAIRVYSADGAVLFEAWHWGSASETLWVPQERLIVLSGCNNEHPLEAYGIPGTDLRWPRVVFAVRPRFGARQGWVNPRLARPGEAAAWYRCILPLEAGSLIAPATRPPLLLANAAEHPARVLFTISALESDAPGASLTFVLDAEGSTLSPQPSDGWKQRDHPLRRMDLRLGGLPEPLVPGE